MRKTIADATREEGALQGQREQLLDMFRDKFGMIPPDVEATILATKSVEQLRAWNRAGAKARKLKDAVTDANGCRRSP